MRREYVRVTLVHCGRGGLTGPPELSTTCLRAEPHLSRLCVRSPVESRVSFLLTTRNPLEYESLTDPLSS